MARTGPDTLLLLPLITTDVLPNSTCTRVLSKQIIFAKTLKTARRIPLFLQQQMTGLIDEFKKAIVSVQLKTLRLLKCPPPKLYTITNSTGMLQVMYMTTMYETLTASLVWRWKFFLFEETRLKLFIWRWCRRRIKNILRWVKKDTRRKKIRRAAWQFRRCLLWAIHSMKVRAISITQMITATMRTRCVVTSSL